jgi:hypothetical protein
MTRLRRALLSLVALALAPSLSRAQSLSGSADASVEAYGVSGREARRPGAIGRIALTPTLDLWGIQIGTNLTWDSETQFAARSLNRYAINPRLSWGELWLGDHAPSLGPTVLEGTVVRGGGLRVQRGRLGLRLHGGRADDAAFVDPLGFGAVDARLAAPSIAPLHRALAAASVAYGSTDRTLEFSTLWASDRTPAAGDTTAPAPQANLLAALTLRYALPRGWRVEAGASGALHTQDTRRDSLAFSFEEKLGGAGRPLDQLFTVRESTRGDVAWHAELAAPAPWGTWRVRAEQIGPGYVTLGVPTLPTDWRQIEGATSFAAIGGRISGALSGGVRTDGVVAAGAGQTWRGTGTVVLNAGSGPWSVAVAGLLNKLERRAAVDTFGLVNVARSISIAPRFAIGTAHALGVSAAWQDNEARAGILAPYGAHSINAAITWEWIMRDGLNFSVSPSLVAASDTTELERLKTASATLSWRPRKGSASGSLAVTGGQSLVGDQLQVAGDLRLALGRVGTLVARTRVARFSGTVSFSEALASLGLSRSFR